MKRSGLMVAVAATVLVFSLRQDLGAAPPTNSAETYKQLNLFGEVFERVRAEYVDEVSDDTLVESAINGMLTSLDAHSNYLNAKNFNDMKVQTRGEFGGLGIEVSMDHIASGGAVNRNALDKQINIVVLTAPIRKC